MCDIKKGCQTPIPAPAPFSLFSSVFHLFCCNLQLQSQPCSQ
jgi:hypothetical protein